MAARKTINFLPTIFQTDVNDKFLSATMDQLVSEPALTNLYGYIGRKFTPTYKNKDSYVIEGSADRQNYQLEPSIVIKDEQDDITFFSSYLDLLDKIKYYGGLVNDHTRLFNGESYTFDPLISYDKFVNFNQYYWLPNGPDPVDVNTEGIPLEATYTVTRNASTGQYIFESAGTRSYSLVLARGGVYKFVVDQAGSPFWIQSELGIDGLLNATPTISSRDVMGVENNGAEVGTITFTVPQSTAQDRFSAMATVFVADYATPLNYSDLQNQFLSQFLAAYPQYAGITGQLDGKHLIFVIEDPYNTLGETVWTMPEVHDPVTNAVISGYDAGTVIPEAQRYGVWQVKFITVPGVAEPLVRLVWVQDVALDEKVYIRYGLVNANKEFYKDYDGFFHQMPLLTAMQDTVYIQDGADAAIYNTIKVVEFTGWQLDVENDILGKVNYTSPNGVEFTTGLKVRFGLDALPESYQNNEYYVENVGDSIRLVDVTLLTRAEGYLDELALNYPGQAFPEYITINRCSKDLNPWSRNNRWFHREVINVTAKYRNETPTYDQNLRARRPIIQFDADVQLVNNGRSGKKAIDILDTTTLDAFVQLEGQVLTTAFGVELVDGMRVIFANDVDPLVRDKIYVLNLVQYQVDQEGIPFGPKYINLTIADDGDGELYDCVVVTQGQYKGQNYWFNGTTWVPSQQKTELQQDPLFDVFDANGNSYTDPTYYPRTTFIGTRLFGYDRTGSNYDSVLGFNLKYRSFATQGDIEFANYFNSDTFEWYNDQQKIVVEINNGFMYKISDKNNPVKKNTWVAVPEPSKQYQLFTYFYTDNPTFVLDVIPAESVTIPYVKVFKNFKYLTNTEWTASGTYGSIITINTPLTAGDKIDILVFSYMPSGTATYQIPSNLDLNAQNLDLTSLTLGQIRNHLIELSQNCTTLEGDILANSNLRDIEIKAQGGTILQHAAPVPYASLFLLDDQANFVSATKFAQLEYSKFKNKFLELAVSLPGIQPTNAPASVDLILSTINSIKNSTFPWYYSDMVPYGSLKSIVSDPGYTVFDPFKRTYEITNIFSDQQLSNQAVLVYITPSSDRPEVGWVQGQPVQLIKNLDYYFNTDRPAVTFYDTVPLAVDDLIVIVEYSNTDGNYIPETPTKLGLWPKFIPNRYLDETYRSPTEVIRGHDGSTVIVFGDYRDDFLLELERRIYNNIKLPDTGTYADIFRVIPGKFRDSEYTLADVNKIVGKSFMSWVGNNKLDFSTNSTFESNDPFTWNYSKFADRIDGEALPGSWRACFQYYYDTYTPHLTPWEMLGFSSMPDWWESFYGVGPYTGGNTLLWDDLEAGRIRFGPRSYVDDGYGPGIDRNFARPGLSQVIPVDENGYLKNPAQFMTREFNSKQAATSWAVGNYGPTEFAWRTSSDFPFAVQLALAVAKPATFFGVLIDTYRYYYDYELKQYVTLGGYHHLRQTDIAFNGDTTSGEVNRSAGYLNWIADYLTSQGISPASYINPMLKNYQVNLSYKMAGFTDQKYLQILAEQSSPTSTNDSVIIPNENYRVFLNENPVPVQKLVYSGVIIERSANGYTVRGYDINNSFFTIIPSVVNNNSFKIKVLNKEVTIFNDFQNLKLTVPYGYEFVNQQQVADFLISYERYLVAQGFRFEDNDDTLGETRNWKLSIKEFLFWAQQGWAAGSILVVSPVANILSAVSSMSITAGIEDSQYGSKILDQNFKLVKNNNYTILRTPGTFKVTITDPASVVGYVEVNLVQYEHTLIFDNVTVFNDIIYKPELGNRQYRLKLTGQKTSNWDGSLSAPGFIYNSSKIQIWNQGQDYLKGEIVQYKNQYYTALQNVIASPTFEFVYWKQISVEQIQTGLLPNFSSIGVTAQSYYDSYGSIKDSDQIDYSHSLIGYKSRQYLNDLGLSPTTQIEFYKGYIKQKGTANAVKALTTAEFNNLSSSINYYEEWAVRIGEYGALDNNPFVEIALDEKAFSVNPGIAQFVYAEKSNTGDGVNIFNLNQLYKTTPAYNGNIALIRNSDSDYNNDIPTAGYVNIDDVDATIFDLANYKDLDNNLAGIGSGYTIWVAKDFTQNWNVYRVTETNNFIIQVSNSLDGYITFTSKVPHKLSVNDIFLVRGFDANFDGFYQVYKKVDNENIMVTYAGNTSNLTTQTGNGFLMVLNSLRFQYMEDCRTYGLLNPPNGWKVGEKVWINDDAATTLAQGQPIATPSGTWKVYEKAHPWTLKQTLDKNDSEYASYDGYGTSVKMSADGYVTIVGTPQTNEFKLTTTGYLVAKPGDIITQPATGANLTFLNYDSSGGNKYLVKYNNATSLGVGNIYINGIDSQVRHLETLSATGLVNVFLKDVSAVFNENNTLFPTAANTKEFGSSIDIGTDPESNEVVAIGAPGSASNIGFVSIYNRTVNTTEFVRSQVLAGHSGDRFGSSIAFNQDGAWLYVGAPGNNKVYVYGYNENVPFERYVASINNKNTLQLSGAVTANIGDIITQPGSGASATVVANIASNVYLQVTTLTNFYTNPTIEKYGDVTGSLDSKIYITLSNVAYTNITGVTLNVGGYLVANVTLINGSVTATIPSASLSSNVSAIVEGATVTGTGIYAGNTTVSSVSRTYVVSGNVLINGVDYGVYPSSTSSVPVTNEIDLPFFPQVYNDADSLIVINNERTFVPGVDYTLDNNKLYFTANLSQGDIDVIQQPYYTLVATLGGEGFDNTEYGYALSSSYDGAQLAVGAPNANVLVDGEWIQGAGTVWVYDRVIEAYVSDGGTDYITVTPITLTGNIGSVYRVTVDDKVQTNLVDYFVVDANTVRFITIPPVGTVIYIETNQFNLLEKLIGVDSLEGGLGAIQQNARFGTSLTICSNNCAIYVGAPYYDNGTQYNTGAVWKFHNRGRLYGTNTGYAVNPTFNVGDTIRLDNFEITVANVNTPASSVASLDDLIANINSAGILGVSAVKENGRLRLNSDKTVAKNLLRILSGSGSVYYDADLRIFAFMQIIVNPYSAGSEYFGTKVKLASNAYMLVIGCGQGTTRALTTIDNGETIFDSDTTRWFDSITGSGSVYIYELYDDPRNEVEHPGRYQFAQQLNPGRLRQNAQFGYAIDIEGVNITVAAPTDATNRSGIEGSGVVYIFENILLKRGWQLIRHQQDKVDIDSVNRLYLYDSQSNTILENLQLIDPAKGRILGQAEQEITYKTEYDPAIYNTGTNPAADINTSVYWTSNQVGQCWWNLSLVRFIDYEQDTLTYRSINWGRLFPGSVIEVCEWVESPVIPSQYVAAGYDGEPKYADDSAYVKITYVDPITNIIGNKYFFWVKNKTSVDPTNPTRNLPTSEIEKYILNPKTQNIAYAAVIRPDALIVYNAGDYLSAKNTILHIDYEEVKNTSIIHSEYELIQKGNPNNFIPEKISNKMIDSISGIDKSGGLVPDPKLSVADRYGVSTRPRQSMFIDRLTALNELVTYVNGVLIVNPIAKEFSLGELNSAEPLPNLSLGVYDANTDTYIPIGQVIDTDPELEYINLADHSEGYTVLVKSDSTQDGLWTVYRLLADKTWFLYKVQAYKTKLYWSYADWYADGYSAAIKPNYSVETVTDALVIPRAVGDIIKVNNVGNGEWELLLVEDPTSLEFKTIGIQNGTIQLNNSLANYADNQLGFGNQGFATKRYDQNPNIEVRAIIRALKENIFINQLQGEFNKLFFVMMNYLFEEQKFTDWIFKTSFISVTHQLRTLSQFPSYIRDNQTYYQDYINEIKPYRTKIREYLLDYRGEDQFNGSVTDFDLPAYYDTTSSIFRSPSGEYGYVSQDEALWQTYPYNQWYNNRTYSIGSVVIETSGLGYVTPPLVTVLGGGGSGAELEAVIDGDTGAILRINVIKSGSGYSTTPTININGSADVPATAYAKLTNSQIRSFDTTLKFDRISYSSSIKEWQPNTAYTVGDIITYATVDGDGARRFAYTPIANMTSGTSFISSDYTVVSSNTFTNANDRIIGYYEPTDAMIPRDLNQLIYGIEYPGVQVRGIGFNQGPGFGGETAANLTVSGAITVSVGDFITQGNANVQVKRVWGNTKVQGVLTNTADFHFGSGNIYIESANVWVSGNISINGVDQNSIRPTELEYITTVDFTPFDINPYDAIDYDEDGNPIISTSTVDTIIRSNYTDLALGTRPEDIDVDGGAYVDRYSSHAPEELVPGIMFDTLDMQVFTKINGDTETLGYRIFTNMMRETNYLRVADAYSTRLAQPLVLTDTEIVLDDASVLPEPGVADAIPGVIFIGGERITYWAINYTTNTLSNIRRGTEGTAAKYHRFGTIVVDGSVQQIVSGTVADDTSTTANVWYNLGANIATDGTGFEGATTTEVSFLKASPATILAISIVSDAITTEDAINTLSTEDDDPIYEEDQE